MRLKKYTIILKTQIKSLQYVNNEEYYTKYHSLVKTVNFSITINHLVKFIL